LSNDVIAGAGVADICLAVKGTYFRRLRFSPKPGRGTAIATFRLTVPASLRRILLIVLFTGSATTFTYVLLGQVNPALTGQWSGVQNLPYNPIHATLLPTGKVFFWDQYQSADFPQLWDPQLSVVTPAARAGYNIFCSGFCLLGDGRLLLAGGHIADNYGLATTATYNPFTDSWTRHADMNRGRWYPTLTTLANGDALVVSGMMDTTNGMNLLPQVFQAALGTWRSLTSAQLQLPYYPYMFVAPNGKAFAAGPAASTRYLDTANTGAWTSVANAQFGARNWGSSVMYEPGKVLLIGGSTCEPYNYSCPYLPTETVEAIDLTAASPSWRYVAPMTIRRKQHNAVVLPDGNVLVVGGTSGTAQDGEANAVFAAEMWNPAANTWTPLASNAVYRGYHSVALLLPDGRVWVGGGNGGSGPGGSGGGALQPNAEVFSPPYLFKGARPSIASAPSTAARGATVLVQTPDAVSITAVTLTRLGSVTHTFNQDQRFARLPFSQAADGLNVTFPSNPSVAPPGYYMLFIINSTGVPSVAKIIRLTNASAPAVPAAPSSLTATAASSSQINLSWTDNAGNEDGFKVERCQGSSCTDFTQIGTVGANVTTFANSGLAADGAYRYRVRAYSTAGDSGYSNIAAATTLSTAAIPASPTALNASAASNSQINLTWTDNASNENGFKIERCQGSGCTNFAQVATVGTNVTSYANTGLTAGTSYSYRVRASSTSGDSGYSNTATATTQSTVSVPAAPTGLTASPVSRTQINLSWTDNSSNESGFRIERSRNNKYDVVATVGPNVTSYADMQLAPGTRYSYRVAAFNTAGSSPYSNKASGTTPR
jgi:fibronectin type 3 domain-containing protein